MVHHCEDSVVATYDELKFKVLWKLYHLKCWGSRHIAGRDIPKGLPPSEVGGCLGVLDDLVRQGLVARKKHKYGDPYRYYLNRHRYEEIRAFLEKMMGESSLSP